MSSSPKLWILLLVVLPSIVFCASPAGDVVGQVTAGYQGWFSTPTDGSPGVDGRPLWWKWSKNQLEPPSLTNTPDIMYAYPDMRDHTKKYTTNYPALGNGQPATVFSSFDSETLDLHLKQMKDHGIHTAALQRFSPVGGEGAIRDAITARLRTSAEKQGVKFYIMYDITSWWNMKTEIKTDWLNKMKTYTSSSAYAKQNGKPVVCIWGFGFNDAKRNFTVNDALEVINWFRDEQGVYLIGGVPTWWHRSNGAAQGDVRAGFFPTAFQKFDMISPWLVGRIENVEQSDGIYRDFQVGDQQWINDNNKDYQPCVLPGDLQVKGRRRHGDLYWRMYYNSKRLGAQGVYISMFDEYQEGNQIAKTAESKDWIPVGSTFPTLDEDGTRCTADYYLRLTLDGSKMFRGETALTETRSTNPWP